MSVSVFCENQYKNNCLRCGEEVEAGAGVYGEFIASYKQKLGKRNSSDFVRLDYQKGTFCKDCQEYLDKE